MQSFLLVANTASSVVNFRLDLLKAVVERGWKVHVACPDAAIRDSDCAILRGLGVEIHDVPMSRAGVNPFQDLMTLWGLYRLMARLKPNRVLAYTIKPVVYGGLAAGMAGIPQCYALVTGLGYAFIDDGKRDVRRSLVNRVARFLYWLALNRCRRVFFQNPDDEALFRRYRILQASTPTTIVNGSGVNLDRFRAVPMPDVPAFILVARLLIDKGVREYAAAARQLKKRYPDVPFYLVGYLDENPESISREELESWIEAGVIEYLGKLSDVRPALATATVFVLPSYREGVPRTVLEAMAMGRAIITTDAPGCRQTVIAGRNGFLVAPRSASELAIAMERFIVAPELAKDMGARSLAMAADLFDVHKVNDMMLARMEVASDRAFDRS